jgi:hypothetical protein
VIPALLPLLHAKVPLDVLGAATQAIAPVSPLPLRVVDCKIVNELPLKVPTVFAEVLSSDRQLNTASFVATGVTLRLLLAFAVLPVPERKTVAPAVPEAAAHAPELKTPAPDAGNVM